MPARDIVQDILRIASRYILAGALFQSGMRMVLSLAGMNAGPVELVTPLGEFSGAQFAGIWLGVSPLFQALGGLVEVAAGLLLLSRRTTTLGALIAFGCFTTSLMLNLSFRPSPWIADVLLLLPAAYLILLDWRVLVGLLLLDRPTMPLSIESVWETPQSRRIGVALKVAFLIYVVYASAFQMIRLKQDTEVQSDLSGVYSVVSFSPSDADLQHRWRAAAIDRYAEWLTIRTQNGNGTTFQIQPLPSPGSRLGHREHIAAVAEQFDRLELVAPGGSVSKLNYSRPSSERLILTGEIDGIAIAADLRLISPDGLPFLNKDISFAEPR